MEDEVFDVDKITGYNHHPKTPEAWHDHFESEEARVRNIGSYGKHFTAKESKSYKNNGTTDGLLPSRPIRLNP